MSDGWRNALSLIQQIIIWGITVFWIYQLIISFASLFKIKEKPLIKKKKHKFMVLSPAHNEEDVIGNLIDSMKKIDYPEELYDIYVIADNCDDNTAQIAREHGANVYERFDKDKKTKGYALNWFFNKIHEEGKKYDAICFFDADNVVDSQFLNEMNKKLCQGESLVQGYRDIKNPYDSWVSGGYAIFYWMMNKFYHLARYNIGLSPNINGTAFMVRWDKIIPLGWNTETLTEDIEFSLINITEGTKLGWAKDAVVYDEQPVSFKQSWTQRERWTVGHLQIVKIYFGDLVKAPFKNKQMINFDAFLYILGIPIMILTILLLGVNTVFYLIGEMSLTELLTNYLIYFVTTFIQPVIAAVIVLMLDKRPILKMWKAILMYPIFMGSWIVINIKALFAPNVKWDKIKHTKAVGIEEVPKTSEDKD